MNKFRQRVVQILDTLGLTQKARDNNVTQSDWEKIRTSYKEHFGVSMDDDAEASDSEGEQEPSNDSTEQNAMTQEQLDQMQSILSQCLTDDAPQAEGGVQSQSQTQAPATAESNLQLAQSVTALVRALENQAVPDEPAHQLSSGPLNVAGPGTTTTHLFGIDHSMFSMENRWNRIAANPNMYHALGTPTQSDSAAFFRGVETFAASLQSRYVHLSSQHMLNVARLSAGTFSTETATGSVNLGDQYLVRRQDALIARLIEARDLTQYFPIQYGIQDRETLFNAFFESVSQAYQSGEVYKGGMRIEAESGHVDDAMIKVKFGPYKELERKYFAYLNREGSDPIKWSLIEFCILNSLLVAIDEQNDRRMNGIYIKPEVGIADHYLHSSTGIFHTLIRYQHEQKLLAHDSEEYSNYTNVTMLDAVQEFIADVQLTFTRGEQFRKLVLYLNKAHKGWWKKNIRARYGKDTDFEGPDGYANVVPDTDVHIIWLPYLGQQKLMFMQEPGNIEFLEYQPGEMLALQTESQMEMVRGWSVWKEGTAATFTGPHFSSLDELKSNNYEQQAIFMNKPCVSVVADATALDASQGFYFVTTANSKDTEITSIQGAKKGVGYYIECGDTTNASVIKKAGLFDGITKEFTPTQSGDYIFVALRSNGHFAELERCVGGIRTVNEKLQPNVIGGR